MKLKKNYYRLKKYKNSKIKMDNNNENVFFY